MRKRIEQTHSPIKAKEGERVVIPHDPVNEIAVLAAALADGALLDVLLRKILPDHFLTRETRESWVALGEIRRRGLEIDRSSVVAVAGEEIASFLTEVSKVPVAQNANWHVTNLLWDSARATAAKGPVPSFLEALRDPKAEPERVRSLARQIALSFDGHEDRKYLHDAKRLVRDQMIEIENRVGGHASYPYGLPGLDFYDPGMSGVGSRRRMIPGAAPGQITVLTGTSGGGKALDINTPIPTPSGWTTMGRLGVGSNVFDENGEVVKVLATSEIMYGRPCYEVVFSDGAKIVADENHLWKTLTARERGLIGNAKKRVGKVPNNDPRYRGIIAQNQKNRVRVPVGGFVRTTKEILETLKTNGGGHTHSIECSKPLQLPKCKLPIEPYTLGVWLGDGTSATGHYTSADPEIAEEIRRRGYNVRKLTPKYRWVVDGLHMRLKACLLLNAKRIPPEYLRASFEQRLDLLRGLMDTDGSRTKCNKNNFDTTNEILAQDVYELMTSLGIKVRAAERVAKLYGRVISKSWRFVFCTDLDVFSLPRKANKQRPTIRGTHNTRYIVAVNKVESVPVKCIKVSSSSSLFLAGEGMVPTHNSTLAASMALGIAFPEGVESDAPGRKVLYCAWEMRGGMTLELIACISLGWSRSELMEGLGPVSTHEGKMILQNRMELIASRVRFLAMPFRRVAGEKPSNDRNLDILHGYIADSGCEVFIADLWKRLLRDASPEAEEDALVRQQAMVEDCRVHGILLQQQRLKDMEAREDKRPTREGIKGSGAWVEVADTIIAPHRPALWKKIDDDKLEILVLKQRYGKWPLAIEFDWNAERGSITGGRAIEYDRPGEATELDSNFLKEGTKRKKVSGGY